MAKQLVALAPAGSEVARELQEGLGKLQSSLALAGRQDPRKAHGAATKAFGAAQTKYKQLATKKFQLESKLANLKMQAEATALELETTDSELKEAEKAAEAAQKTYAEVLRGAGKDKEEDKPPTVGQEEADNVQEEELEPMAVELDQEFEAFLNTLGEDKKKRVLERQSKVVEAIGKRARAECKAKVANQPQQALEAFQRLAEQFGKAASTAAASSGQWRPTPYG